MEEKIYRAMASAFYHGQVWFTIAATVVFIGQTLRAMIIGTHWFPTLCMAAIVGVLVWLYRLSLKELVAYKTKRGKEVRS